MRREAMTAQRPVGARVRLATVGLAAIMAIAGVSSTLTEPLRAAGQSQAAPALEKDAAAHRQLLTRYCVSCHSDRLKTGGLSLQSINLDDVAQHAEVLEKVFRKLRAGAMPPTGLPRPDPAASAAFTAWLEGELDRAAARSLNPGRAAKFHRLNRTEYQNAIRDILGLEIDAAPLLPGDDAAFGFDNIGEMLTVSPDLLDRYLSAANKISRLAVGDPALPLGSATYSISQFLLQADRMSPDLPFGSRGGAAIRHYFPYDGEYVVKIRFAGVARPPQPVEVRLDGTLVASPVTRGRDFEDIADSGAVEARVAVTAGPHSVGVSFVKNTLAAESRFPQYFPWGNSATFGTNTGSVRYLNVNAIDISGPFSPQGPGDTPSRRQIFVCRPAKPQDADGCAERILARLARHAYRRPVTRADIDPLLAIYRKVSDRDFDGRIQMALERLLVDPDFLFRVGRGPADVPPGTPYRLGDLDLASRLSFFLWSSVPDEELLRLAERGRLKERPVFEQQVRRMIADQRSRSLVSNFAGQWLFLRNVRAAAPDSYQFPDWDDDLRAAFVQETELFLDHQIHQDRSVAELLTANYTFLNERLARHYGISNVYGSHFRPVTLKKEHQRGGLLGHGSILLVTSYPNRTSPVLRGKWLLENFLNYEPPPPPPNVPDLPPVEKGQAVPSIRERLEQHRKNAACAACHAVMDPLGFALEHYDAIGTYRTKADGQPVDASGVTPDGTKFSGLDGLRSVMETRRGEFVATVAEKLLIYALGRGLEYYDRPVVRRVVREAAATDYRWSSIILGIATSVPFQMTVREGEP
jgi:mono/diheme cytochrome c family protein